MSERKEVGVNYTYEPLQFFGLAHYNSAGHLQSLEVGINGRGPVSTNVEPNEDIGDLFMRAFEGAKVLMLTERAEPVYAVETEAGSR